MLQQQNNMVVQPPRNIMLCAVEGDKIVQVDYMGNSVQIIGATQKLYEGALKMASEYRDKLIEAGILQKEKTPQEIQQEQSDMIKQLLGKVNDLEERLNGKPVNATGGANAPTAKKTNA